MANENLELLNNWLILNKLTLNPEKSNYIVFRTHQAKTPDKKLKIILNGDSIKNVTYTKFLGLFIDENLTWKHHMQHVLKKFDKI